MASIQGIYIALFGRPADPTGLAFFNEATNNGADLTAIGDLASTAEYQTRFEGKTSVDIITDIYFSLFGRNPEQAGLSFFSNALANGTLNINNIAIAILDGAQGDDLKVVQNKEKAADAFTAAIDTADEIAAYRGDGAADAGRAFLAPIGANTATIPTQTQTDLAVKAILDGAGDGSGGVGVTLYFTPSADPDIFTPTNGSFKTTSGDDTVISLVAGHYANGDIVVGGDGTDTIKGLIDGTLTTLVTQSVEKITLTGVGAVVLDASSAAGAELISNVKSDNTFDVDNVAKGVVVGVEGAVGGATTFDYVDAAAATGSDVAHLSLTSVSGGYAITIDTATAGGNIETLDITVSGSSTVGDVDIAGGAGKVVIAGSGDLTVGAGSFANAGSVDASDLTGGLKGWASAGGVEFTGGKGSDVVTLAGTDVLVYDTDNISINAKIDSISGFNLDTPTTYDNQIDVSAFAFDGAVQKIGEWTELVNGKEFENAANERTAVNFFDNGTDLFVAFDTNNNGSYDIGSDLVVKLVGLGGGGGANLDVSDIIWS